MTDLEALAKKSRADNERLNTFMDGIEEFIQCLQKTKPKPNGAHIARFLEVATRVGMEETGSPNSTQPNNTQTVTA